MFDKRKKSTLAVCLTLAAFLAQGTAFAFPPEGKPTARDPAPVIILPDNPTPPPPPVPPPAAMQTLSADQLYVVRASAECVVMGSPDGLIKITSIASPSTIRAKFIDGNGSYETRTYSDKYLYTVEAASTGKCELIVVSGSTVARRCLNVVNGPPPVPPTPPTPANPLTAALQAAYALDTDKDKGASLAYLQAAFVGMAGQATTWNSVTTTGQAATQIKGVVETPNLGLTESQIVNLRKAIMADFVSTFGSVSTKAIALSDLQTWLAKISSALSGVK